MKFSVNTIKKYLDFELPSTNELVEKIGAQLGAIDEVIDLGKKYQNIVIAKVLECKPHPKADKLQICLVDNGQAKVQVVCGAPNVREGMLTAWLPPGATVPQTIDKEPFILEAREIRGVKSNGMLASPKELALGDNHEGLLIIDGDYKPGTDFAAAFGLKDDVVIDIENKMFTHRPDCFGFLGLARELAGIHHKPFKSPDWYNVGGSDPEVEGKTLPLEIKNEIPDLVPRFSAVAMSDVKVGPSLVWLQVELAKVGIKSINNIVDYTNWFMLETGQPLHAYDYDKVKKLSQGDATIVIRKPKAGEKVKLLNGKEIEPRTEDIMIATNKQLIGLGGVMGGADTEVDENTNNIILECANFDMYAVRRTSMAHGLFTDAVTRFTKGQSPLQTRPILVRIVNEIRKTGGKVASKLVDDKRQIGRPRAVRVSTDFINIRLGLNLDGKEISNLLKNVEFEVKVSPNELSVTSPFWRTDIEIPEDVVEEVGRLYGYDKLPLELPRRAVEPGHQDPLLTLKAQTRERLSQAGANEILTYSFVSGDLLDKVGQDKSQAFQIANALSPELQYYRLSLMPSLLEKVHPNIKAGYNEFALFEIGKTHSLDLQDKDRLPGEFEFTALVVTADDKLKKAGVPYYQARKFLTNLAGTELEFKPVGDEMQKYPVVQPYDLQRSALVSIKGGDFLGIIGEFKASVRRALKLPRYIAGFEVDTTILQKAFDQINNYVPLPRFPGVNQDITLQVTTDTTYQTLYDLVKSQIDELKPANTVATLESVDIYQPDNEQRNITFRLHIASHERSLTDKEVNKLLDEMTSTTKSKLKVTRV